MRRASEIASLSPPVCRGATTLAESHHGTRAGLRESKGGRLSTEQQIGLMRREYTLGSELHRSVESCWNEVDRLREAAWQAAYARETALR